MDNPFTTAAMAAGYAADRPPLHGRILAQVRNVLSNRLPVARALDIGCGAGLSTAPLCPLARQCVGLEPAAAMLAASRTLAPGARFLVGSAAQLPFATASIDLVTAAGSLNFMPLTEALADIHRVLAPDGVLVAYDWATAGEFPDHAALDAWFTHFRTRYPRPPTDATFLDPPTLAGHAASFTLTDALTFCWPITMTADAYARYMLTETNVAAAVRGGTPLDDIRAWCHETLTDVFDGRPREVLFRGYIAYLRPGADSATRTRAAGASRDT